MRTPAQIAGHPIHPMLVAIPIGLWIFSLACDLIAMGSSTPEVWRTTALHAMVGGIIGALAAALPGLVDLLSLRDPAIKKTALTHMALNLTVVALFAINAWMRQDQAFSVGTSLLLSVVAVGLLAVSGWLGGKMVYLAGVAVSAGDTTPSSSQVRGSDWQAGRSAAAASSRTWAPGERAMASDSDRPLTERERERASAPGTSRDEGPPR